MSRLAGKVVLVPRAARGIGAASARAAVTEGAKVVIGDVSDRDGEALITIEIDKLAVFLANDESAFSTGAGFIADGGELAGLIRQSGEPSRRSVEAGR